MGAKPVNPAPDNGFFRQQHRSAEHQHITPPKAHESVHHKHPYFPVDRKAFGKDRRQYWKDRAKAEKRCRRKVGGDVNVNLPVFTIERFVMLDDDFKEYLNDEFGRILPESKEKYHKLFKDLGFGEVNHDFIEFWATYSDEIYGKIGYLVDLAMDLEDFSSSQTEILRKNIGLPDNYFSLLNNELDDYILYDKNTDEVFFVEAPDIQKFIENKQFSKHWDSFEYFIKDYLNYNA